MSETPETPETQEDFELPDVEAMQQYVTRIQAGAAILYSLINEIYNMHEEHEGNCKECGKRYPCHTASVLLENMVEEKPSES